MKRSCTHCWAWPYGPITDRCLLGYRIERIRITTHQFAYKPLVDCPKPKTKKVYAKEFARLLKEQA